MDRKELDLIAQLMEELQGQMEDSHDDFDERLGRKKPDLEILKVEGKDVRPEIEESDEHEMSESPEFEAGEEEGMMEDEESSPEEALKKRIMALRGK